MLDLLWSLQLNTATKSKGWYNLSCRCMLTHNIPQLTHGLHHNTSNASPVPVSQPLVRYCPNTLEDVFFDAEEAPSEILKCWILYTRFWTWTLHNLILVSGWEFLNAISKKVISCDIQSNQVMRWGDPKCEMFVPLTSRLHQGQSTAKYMTDHDWIPESIYILLLYGSLSKRRPIIQYMGVMPYTIHILWHWGGHIGSESKALAHILQVCRTSVFIQRTCLWPASFGNHKAILRTWKQLMIWFLAKHIYPGTVISNACHMCINV